MNMIPYFDHNATTPVDASVLQTMLPYFTEQFGNASSGHHAYGQNTAHAVAGARASIAELIGCEKEELLFTSGATESINLVLRGITEAYASKGNHIITCATEHKAVLDTCLALQKKGMEITVLPVASNGSFDLKELEASIKPTTILIALMYANNETGIIHPVKDISTIAKAHNTLFFCDATQAIGKVPVDVLKDDIDILAFSSHKLYGPKGCGALYVRRKNPRVRLTEQITGGGHERNLRSGTLNVPGIVGFGKAAALCKAQLSTDAAYVQQLRDLFEQEVCRLTGASINGTVAHRLPNTTNLCFDVPNGISFISDLNKLMAVSSGSACSSAKPEASHVLKAMGMEEAAIKRSVRFSFGRMNTEAEIRNAIAYLCQLVKQHQL
jgi:cysteine desulfurase